MADSQQNYRNHSRIVPIYHFGVFLPLLANFVWTAFRLTGGVTGDALMAWVVSVALILAAFSLRAQILTVQDRVIRLEMRLRLAGLLAEELAARAAGLSVKHLVALRFASDSELPGLVHDVLEGRLQDQKSIKQAVKEWQGDFLRA